VIADRGAPGCSLPVDSKGFVTDYPYSTWDMREWLSPVNFHDNDLAVAIEVSAVTKNGVAQARLRYPRQYSNRYFVTINAEANGVRDNDGERFLLLQMKAN
jgi:hypothetical protein